MGVGIGEELDGAQKEEGIVGGGVVGGLQLRVAKNELPKPPAVRQTTAMEEAE